METTPRLIMVTGGARSGKSRLAESTASRFSAPLLYVATAEAGDGEMTQRILDHRARRGPDWATIEEPRDLAGVLRRSDDGRTVRLVDCLTLWLANIMSDGETAHPIAELADVLSRQRGPVVLVTNELGLGIVPENALARRFRDEHGWMNQAIAAIADEVWMAVSGLPLRLKPERGTS